MTLSSSGSTFALTNKNFAVSTSSSPFNALFWSKSRQISDPILLCQHTDKSFYTYEKLNACDHNAAGEQTVQQEEKLSSPHREKNVVSLDLCPVYSSHSLLERGIYLIETV
jgi:hypothetical protein